MTFDEFYDYEFKGYYLELQDIIMSGKTLDYQDCDKFWKLFKKSTKKCF